MDTFNYSIVIRTLGNTGDKYLQMLRTIERQTVKPLEILVVIPEGYSLDHQLGTERIIRSEKGMVTQRAVGIMEAKGEYLLVLDDDLDFPPNFAEQMHDHLNGRHRSFSEVLAQKEGEAAYQKNACGVHRTGILQQTEVEVVRHNYLDRWTPYLYKM